MDDLFMGLPLQNFRAKSYTGIINSFSIEKQVQLPVDRELFSLYFSRSIKRKNSMPAA
jgi:hypothetical protein